MSTQVDIPAWWCLTSSNVPSGTTSQLPKADVIKAVRTCLAKLDFMPTMKCCTPYQQNQDSKSQGVRLAIIWTSLIRS